MTAYIAAMCIFVLCLAVFLFLIFPSPQGKKRFASLGKHYYAHRGLHQKDRSIAENSLRAFELAVSAGYGIELDVQLSKDGKIVVFHDDDLERVCGIDRRVDELTYDELAELRLFDTESAIPLFEDVLSFIKGRSVLIVELKTGRKNKELCAKTLESLRNYEGAFCIESFDPRIVAWFKKNAPDIVRGQLAAPTSSYGDKPFKFIVFLMSRCLANFLSRPDFIAYKNVAKPLTVKICEALGAAKVCWTSRKLNDNSGNAAEIFEYYLPKAI